MMQIAKCNQCGKSFPAYNGEEEYQDCRTHIRAFFSENPQFFGKQINDYSEYFTTKERRDLAMGLKVAI